MLHIPGEPRENGCGFQTEREPIGTNELKQERYLIYFLVFFFPIALRGGRWKPVGRSAGRRGALTDGKELLALSQESNIELGSTQVLGRSGRALYPLNSLSGWF